MSATKDEQKRKEEAEGKYITDWDFYFNPPPTETIAIKVKFVNIGESEPRLFFDEDYIPLKDD